MLNQLEANRFRELKTPPQRHLRTLQDFQDGRHSNVTGAFKSYFHRRRGDGIDADLSTAANAPNGGAMQRLHKSRSPRLSNATIPQQRRTDRSSARGKLNPLPRSSWRNGVSLVLCIPWRRSCKRLAINNNTKVVKHNNIMRLHASVSGHKIGYHNDLRLM